MGNKNYTKYSENTENKEIVINESDIVNVTPVDEIPENVEVTEGVNIIENPEETEGVNIIENPEETETKVKEGSIFQGAVRNCKKLNLRKEPNKNSSVECVLLEDEVVSVDIDESTEDFYKVSARGVHGYCMKTFINIK